MSKLDKSKDLDLPASEREFLFEAIQQYAEDFLKQLPQQKAYVANSYNATDADAFFEINGDTKPINKILDVIKERVDGTGLNPASGGHLGYIPGGGIYTSSLGDYIAAVTNRYASVFYASPGAVRIENALISWAAKQVGYKQHFGGNITSGGSMANLIALYTAKTAKKIKCNNIATSVIYTTTQSHHSVYKALRLLGLDECVIRYIALDVDFKMNVGALKKTISQDKKNKLTPFLIIANAGSTDVGAVDDMPNIALIAEKENLWLHVDAAYGGFFVLTNYGKKTLKGLNLADSVVMDPHKSLFLPYGTGMVLVKKVQHLLEANSYEASYMQDTKHHNQEYSPTELSPEMSRNFRGLRMWLPLKLHGIKPFVDCLNEKIELTRYFCKELQKLGFELGNNPQLTVVIYRYKPKKGKAEIFNRNLLKRIQEDGRVFISSTEIHAVFWLRIAILSFRTHQKEIDILLSLLRKETQGR
ncbi:MAG: aminotransferase class I/II-fold pyridoxal phosphate-dependent enzyme [Bacteroidetes bacterium]|nr:aminotransferase class I/II-fold pyridoxal phosphate-dependent enzyme [Bacteroidota bacterium]